MTHPVPSKPRNNYFLFGCMFCAVLLYTIIAFQQHQSSKFPLQKYNEPCKNVLTSMTTGSWKSQPLTLKEENEMKKFMIYGLSATHGMERSDGKCGSVTITRNMSTSIHGYSWFRALCDPWGPKPCCYQNQCQKKTLEQCHCKGCYDLRSRIYAEWSTWQPYDPRCKLTGSTTASVCKLLSGGQYFFFGDSLVRQIFIGLLMIAKGDKESGPLKPGLSEDIKKNCSGRYSFHANCKPYIDYVPTLCNGTVKIVYREYSEWKTLKNMTKDVKILVGVPKTFVYFGFGIWFNLNPISTKKYAMTVINSMLHNNKTRLRKWPKLMWSSMHSFGFWRYPKDKRVSNTGAQTFNRHMEKIMRGYGIPVMNSVSLTKGVQSFDGTHYGPGVNTVKAEIFLHHILELKHEGNWS